MTSEEFPDQIALETSLERSEQEVDSRSACDEKKHFGERHGVRSVSILGLSTAVDASWMPTLVDVRLPACAR
jgi:hypothetical protein